VGPLRDDRDSRAAPCRSPARALALVLLALGALAAGEARAQAQAEVYRPQHRLAAELLPLAETALGAEGRAVIDPGSNALVLVGPPAAIAGALALLREMDRRMRNVVIQYQERSREELDAAGAEVRWSLSEGPVRIGNARLPADGLDVRAGSAASDRAESRRGSLTVLEGQTGRIDLGTRVPYETGTLGRRRVEFIDASSGFEVTPRVLGDGRVRLALRPYGARVEADGSVATSGAETVLVLAPGETAVLGGFDQGLDAAARLTGRGAAQQQRRSNRLLLIRAQPD
jgi:type II secretory pathway component GspD/PulD (secretin)